MKSCGEAIAIVILVFWNQMWQARDENLREGTHIATCQLDFRSSLKNPLLYFNFWLYWGKNKPLYLVKPEANNIDHEVSVHWVHLLIDIHKTRLLFLNKMNHPLLAISKNASPYWLHFSDTRRLQSYSESHLWLEGETVGPTICNCELKLKKMPSEC